MYIYIWKKVTRKNSAISRTESIARIPVNGAKLEELDSGIREKCRQNPLKNHNLEENDRIYYTVIRKKTGPS